MVVCKNCGTLVPVPGDGSALGDPVAPCPLKKGKLVVHVVDLAGNDIAGVDVSVSSGPTPVLPGATDGTGFFTVDPLEAGAYQVQLTACGNPMFVIGPGATRPATIVDGQLSLLTFELAAWVEVIVVDEDGVTLENIAVTLTAPDGKVHTLTPQDLKSKVYHVGGLVPGECKVSLPEVYDLDWN